MKKLASLTLFCLFFVNLFAQQASIPDAPRKLEFAGVNVKLDPAAQQLVQTEIKALLLPENKYLFDKMARMQWYFPIIEKILEDEEVPEDFKYLAVLESSLNSDVVSTSKAVGFWQIKEETAKELNLKIDAQVDERKNIQAATKAAAIYLKRNNLIYKNWISTLYSYYLGATGISKAVPTNWTYATEIILDGTTDRYIIKALAHRVAYEHRLNRLRESPYSIVEYKAKGKSLSDISSEIRWDINELKRYNTWLNTDKIPNDKEYIVSIFVPIDQFDEMQAKVSRNSNGNNNGIASESGFPVLKKISQPNGSENSPELYEINGKKGILAAEGDDIGQLAMKGKVKPTDLLKFNDISDKDLIEAGKVYYLKTKNRKAKVAFHTVSENQTLWEVSQMYGVRLKQLLKFNRMETVQRLQAGRVVYLQKKRPKNKPVEYLEEIDNGKNKPVKDSRKEETSITPSDKPLVYEEPQRGNKNIPTNKKSDEDIVVKIEPQEASKDEKIEIITTNPVSIEETTQPIEESKVVISEPVIINHPPKKVTPTPSTTPAETKAKTVDKPVESAPKAINSGSYEVQQGETLFSIARKFNIYVRDLAAWNSLTLEDKVRIGQTLILKKPEGAISTTKVEPKKVEEPKSKPTTVETSKTHVVVKGETLFSISKKYGVTMKQVQDWNGMADNNVKLGQKLILKTP